MKNNKTKVSVICNTYNHAKYIGYALESFVTQKTDFAFEVLVHDDASTDGTQDIIRKYEQKYPELIKPIYQTENQYSQHISITKTYQLPRAQGKYIAMCEGDDYWTDPYKLQKQFDAMEAYAEVDMCAHGAIGIDANTGRKIKDICPAAENTILIAEKVIDGEGGYLATNSLFYRKSLLENVPNFKKVINYDYTLQIQGSLRGGILYLKDIMSVYRMSVPGSWTKRVMGDTLKRNAHYNKLIEMFKQLDIDTNYQYHSIIEKKIVLDQFRQLSPKMQYKAFRRPEYKMITEDMTRKVKLKIFLKAYFPWIKTLYRKIKK